MTNKLSTFFFALSYLSLSFTVVSCQQASKSSKEKVEAYDKTIEHFRILDEMAMDAIRGKDMPSKDSYLLNLKKTALGNWVECVNLFDDAKKIGLPAYLEENRTQLSQYANLRILQAQLFIKTVEEDTDKYFKSIDSMEQVITDHLNNIGDQHTDTDTSNLIPLKRSE